MSDLKLQGRITYIGQTEQVNETFSKRDFAIETESISSTGQVFKNTVAMQTVNKACPIMDNFGIGQQVECSFDIRSNQRERNGMPVFYTNITAFHIKALTPSPVHPPKPQQSAPQPQASNDESDLPF